MTDTTTQLDPPRCRPRSIDVDFRSDLDLSDAELIDGLIAVVDRLIPFEYSGVAQPGQTLTELVEEHGRERHLGRLDKLFLEGFGWVLDGGVRTSAIAGSPAPPQARPYRIGGIYWDWTTLDDDMLLMPAIAPFVRSGSTIFFEFRQGSDERPYPGPDSWWDFGGWKFDGATAVLLEAEELKEYEFK